MLKALLFGTALALAATGAEARAPQCRDGKGHVTPCPQKRATASGPSDEACMWLVAHGVMQPCALL